MGKELVIVESPAKAKTLSKILGRKYIIKASLGHVRDLPRSRLGVDVDHDFAPSYEVPKEKRGILKELKESIQKASRVYLATDPDREGEAISWHLLQASGLTIKAARRVVFHEITEKAVKEAFQHPRELDMNLVNAQQARRILDRLVGYRLSPLLWKKVKKGLSAGRVQSAALRMIADREREIEAFVVKEYWVIEAELSKDTNGKDSRFKASLATYLGKKKKIEIPNQEEAHRIVADLAGAAYKASAIKKKQVSRSPAPPFTTSTLQQEAWRRIGFSAKKTMAVAQQLYEGLPLGSEGSVGLITYMRTDSTQVSAEAKAETRRYIAAKYGKEFIPPNPRSFTRKAKGAQEAHEAIRPTGVQREPSAIKAHLRSEQFRLYELIWKRMVASQMSNALLDTTSVDIEAMSTKSRTGYLFNANGSVTKFPGFLILYSESKDEEEEEKQDKKAIPELSVGETLRCWGLNPNQRFTQPPQRYTEATLVKAMEEHGIGRPSTYAPIMSTLQERWYVKRIKGRLHPEELGMVVNDLLAKNFPKIINLGFTAEMEEELDEIARGEREWVPLLREFYQPFEEAVREATVNIVKIKMPDEVTKEVCEKCGSPMVVKTGRHGPFLACSAFPKCKNAKPYRIKTGVDCPRCGGDLVERRRKDNKVFYGCATFPACNFAVNQRPLAAPCPQCGGLLVASGEGRGRCTQCKFKGPVVEEREEMAVAAQS